MAPVFGLVNNADEAADMPVQQTKPATDLEPRDKPPATQFECDYDVDPIQLYQSLQRKNWSDAIARSVDFPQEARTWVSRKEKDGKLRWKLLPLHAAVIYDAPENVVEALLCAYPKGAERRDDQGMLPLHLAFRNGSSEGVVNLLLVAYPKSIDVKDRKGRIPLVLAQASTSPNRDAFMRALERGPTYYAVAAAATERASVTAEQQAIFDARLIETKNQHQYELGKIQASKDVERRGLMDKIAELEGELAKTQETSQVLVDHVNSLEAQLSSRSDTERFLATRIATLDTSLKSTEQAKEELETTLRTDNTTLLAEKAELEKKVQEYEEQEAARAEQLATVETELKESKEEWQEKSDKRETKFNDLELQLANSKANCAILEAQLKKKIETESSLAAQVSSLASRLAESSADAGQSVVAYGSRVRVLEEERDDLKQTVKALTRKLANVAKSLVSMSEDQEAIIHAAAAHEATMAEAALANSQIVEDAKRQVELFEEAKKEREELAAKLAAHEAEVEKGEAERKKLWDAVENQTKQIEVSTMERYELVQGVAKQRRQVEALFKDEIAAIPNNFSQESDILEEIVQSVKKGRFNITEDSDVEEEDDDVPDDEKKKDVSNDAVEAAREDVEE